MVCFGAGNLIFPPALGVLSGENFWPAILGFVVSGVGIAVIALIVGTLNPKGYVHEISRKISPTLQRFILLPCIWRLVLSLPFRVQLQRPLKLVLRHYWAMRISVFGCLALQLYTLWQLI